jgi:hypothetical protein
MLRSSLSFSPSSICKKYNLVTTTVGRWNHGNSLRSLVSTTSRPTLQQCKLLHFRSSLSLLLSRTSVSCNHQLKSSTFRLMSTSGSNTNNKSDQTDATKSTNTSASDGDGKQQSSDSNEIVLTPGETVVAVSRLTMWAGIAIFATACAYYIAMELIPT